MQVHAFGESTSSAHIELAFSKDVVLLRTNKWSPTLTGDPARLFLETTKSTCKSRIAFI